MSKAIERRLAVLERRTTLQGLGVQEIIVRGGLTSGIDPIARFGSHEWEAAPDETFETFRGRAKAAAETEGATHVVFGGMPGPELIASGYLERHNPELCNLASDG